MVQVTRCNGAPGPESEFTCIQCMSIQIRQFGAQHAKDKVMGPGGLRAHRGWCREERRGGRERKGDCLPGVCCFVSTDAGTLDLKRVSFLDRPGRRRSGKVLS